MKFLIEVSKPIYEYLQRIKGKKSISGKASEIIAEYKPKSEGPKTFPNMKSIWYEFYPDYIWSAQDAFHLLGIQRKIILSMKVDDPDPQTVEATFKLILVKLPEWFRGKDLGIINSKYNSIINEIKGNRNPEAEQYIDRIKDKYT
jgi:hypothetical protein